MVRFGSVPVGSEPVTSQWKTKIGEVTDTDISSWVNCLYQDRVFPTQKNFNDAYDSGIAEVLNWRNKPMILTSEDVENFETTARNGGFEFVEIQNLIQKIKAHQACEKIVFVY